MNTLKKFIDTVNKYKYKKCTSIVNPTKKGITISCMFVLGGSNTWKQVLLPSIDIVVTKYKKIYFNVSSCIQYDKYLFIMFTLER